MVLNRNPMQNPLVGDVDERLEKRYHTATKVGSPRRSPHWKLYHVLTICVHPFPRYPCRGGRSRSRTRARRSAMRPAVGTATANPSRQTRPQSLGKARKDIEGLTLPQNQLGRYGLFARPVLVEQTLQDLLRVAVWCFFANWLLQSAVVGWEESRRVAPLEQVKRQCTFRGRTVSLLGVGAIGSIQNRA